MSTSSNFEGRVKREVERGRENECIGKGGKEGEK